MAARRQFVRHPSQGRGSHVGKGGGTSRQSRSFMVPIAVLLLLALRSFMWAPSRSVFEQEVDLKEDTATRKVTNLYEYSVPAPEVSEVSTTQGVCHYIAEELLSDRHETLASILNAGSYAGFSPPNGTKSMIRAAQSIGESNPDSVLGHYIREPSNCFRLPHIPTLQVALDRYHEVSSSPPSEQTEMVAAETTLVVYLTGEKSFSDDCENILVSEIQGQRKAFKNIVVFGPGLSKSSWAAKEDQIRRMGMMLHKWEIRNEDDQLYLMSQSKHLLATGGLGTLGSLLTRGAAYLSKTQTPFQRLFPFELFLQHRVPLRPPVSEVNLYQQAFDKLGPIQHSCCELREFGTEGHQKTVCVTKEMQSPGCWIMSLESRGDWSFELDAAANTECYILVLDCAGDFSPPPEIADRVLIQKICLKSSLERNKENHILWPDLLRSAISNAREHGVLVSGVPDLVKVDFDGLEWEWFQYLLDLNDPSILPRQIAVEIHLVTYIPVGLPFTKGPEANPVYRVMVPAEPMREFGRKISRLGYSVVGRRDWSSCKVCSEILFMRQ